MARLTRQVDRWFDVKDDSDKASLRIKRLKPGELADIEALANEVTMKAGKDGGFVTEIALNSRKRQILTVDAAVIDMKGFFDTKGKEMKCTSATKQNALVEFNWLWPMVEEALSELDDEFNAKEAAAAKN